MLPAYPPLPPTQALFRSMAATELKTLPGVHELMRWAEAERIPKVLVTNAPRCEIKKDQKEGQFTLGEVLLLFA
jgi:hypothetical protein